MNDVLGKLAINDSIVHTTVDGEALVLNVENGKYFGLDGVAARIWQLMERGATKEEIVNQLLEEYDVDAPQLRNDVDNFVASMVANGLVREVAG